MKALITGISGRVGANLAHEMKRRGYDIRGLVMPEDPQADKAARLGVELLEADMADADRLRAAVDGVWTSSSIWRRRFRKGRTCRSACWMSTRGPP